MKGERRRPGGKLPPLPPYEQRFPSLSSTRDARALLHGSRHTFENKPKDLQRGTIWRYFPGKDIWSLGGGRAGGCGLACGWMIKHSDDWIKASSTGRSTGSSSPSVDKLQV